MKLLKLNIFILFYFLSLSFLISETFKPEAMVLPIYFLNIENSGKKISLNNHIKTVLGNIFELKSEKEIEQAKKVAVDRLTSENCTEEACIKIMGEIIDVDYTFSIQIIDTGDGHDITSIRYDMNGLTNIKNTFCSDCDFTKLRKELTLILQSQMPGNQFVETGKASLILESNPIARVFIDGEDQGNTPLNVEIPSETPISVVLVNEDFETYAKEFTLKSKQTFKERIKLVRKKGSIEIDSNPSNAKIYIDGIPYKTKDNQIKISE